MEALKDTWLLTVDSGITEHRFIQTGPASVEQAKANFEQQRADLKLVGAAGFPEGDVSVRAATLDDMTPKPAELDELRLELGLDE
jgi:protein-disulfide isomerase-like protein with CxxC motif